MYFSSQWPVTTDGSDFSGCATIPFLCTLLQETATYHADRKGWGFTPLKAAGLQWVLSRQWLEIEELPRWKDVITVETWASGTGGITWNRDYEITSSSGKVLGRATSLWFLMDRETRRPIPAARGAEILQKPLLPTDTQRRTRTKDLKALPALKNPREIGRTLTSYFDIDIHHHVNNVRYLTWILNALSAEFLNAHQIRELEIHFMAEGFMGEELIVMEDRREADNREALYGLSRSGDGVEMCRMKACWNPVES